MVGVGANVAVTDALAFMVIVQGLVLHPPPLHPVNMDPLAGVADKVAVAPAGKVPAPVTVPVPLPALVAARVYDVEVVEVVEVVVVLGAPGTHPPIGGVGLGELAVEVQPATRGASERM